LYLSKIIVDISFLDDCAAAASAIGAAFTVDFAKGFSLW
jgi:hypothetical protein